MPATPIKYTPKKGALTRAKFRTPEEDSKYAAAYQADLKERYSDIAPAIGRDAVLANPTVDWALENVIQDKALNLLFGEPETYKTFFALDWAFTLNSHEDVDWLGHKRSKRFKPMYLFTEGKAGLKARMYAWESHRDQLTESSDGIVWVWNRTNLMQPPPPRFPKAGETFDLATDSQVKLMQAYDDLGCDMLIIDTFRNTLHGDENSNADVGRYMNTLDEYVDKGPVLLIHHTKKGDKKEYSGATALRGQPDVMLSAWKDKPTSDVVTLEHYKNKDGEKEVVEVVRRKVIEVDDNRSSIVVVGAGGIHKALTKMEKLVLKHVRKHGPITSKDIAKLQERKAQSIDGDLRTLSDRGRIIKDEGRPALWSLAPEPEEI